jgi:hypothetical protein
MGPDRGPMPRDTEAYFRRHEVAMLDVLMIALGTVSFALLIGYAVLCGKL